jgi:putative transcriptional regulator
MSAIKTIRQRLEVTQAELASALGVSQGNVSFYERGQTIPPAVAGRLISFASSKGVELSFDSIYGSPAEDITKPR